MEFSGVLNFVPYEEKMQRVLIIGNSGGIGAALETEYTSRQWSCEGVSRSYDGLDFKYPEKLHRKPLFPQSPPKNNAPK